MKYFFYTILLVGSLGTVAAITNPPLIKQGAALIGWEFSQETDEPVEEEAAEDKFAGFYEQYPFLNVPSNEVVAPTKAPIAVLPPPVQPTTIQTPPPFIPAAPNPIAEPVVPSYAHSWENHPQQNPIQENFNQNISPWEQNISPWDGTATAPIHAAPAVEYQPPPDWSGPFQELAPAPQQSVYVVEQTPPLDVFSAAQNVPDFAQPNPTMPLVQTPPSAPQTVTVPVHGTEIAARVGTHVILMGDILPKLRRLALRIVDEQTKTMTEEQKARISPQEIEEIINVIVENHYPAMLEEQILLALVYSDYIVSRSREEHEFFEGKMTEEFDRVEIPEMMKEFNVENVPALRRFLETHLGSSLDKERRLWIREQIARQWISMSMQRATDGSTHEEMFEFYEKNQAMFTTPNRVRWQEMVVLFSQHDTERQAWEKIVWMGNQVVQGAPFEEIAKLNSDGLTSADGGVWDWTTKGNLASAELEQAIFSQPTGQLSPNIIKTERGLHIVRVLERQEAQVVPFVEAQVTIRDRIRRQREQRHQEEYIAGLRSRIPTIIVKDRIDFNVNTPRTASAL